MKISPYALDDASQDARDFKDEVTNIINYGKYQMKVLYEGTPTWTGKEGEQALCYVTIAGTNLYNFYKYYYVRSAWRFEIAVGVT